MFWFMLERPLCSNGDWAGLPTPAHLYSLDLPAHEKL